jgi:predicted nucleic acid-binding protein
MPLSSEVIISDTSCLILLHKIGEVELLKRLGSKIFITQIIKNEFGMPLPDWIEVKNPKDIHYQEILEMELDPGEASAIALALDLENTVLVIDDLKGRQVAQRLQLKYAGTFGLILRAKQEGIIASVVPILEKVRRTNFRFSEKLLDSIIKQAGE